MVRMTCRANADFQRRARVIRDGYYGGAMSLLTAQARVESLLCEFLSCRDGETRREVAAQIAADYLKPDISGFIEAYDG